VKGGYSVAGKKVVIAGSGPLLLAVAAYLRQRGADVRLIAEQTSRGNLLRFGSRLLWHQPGKIVEALGLRWTLRGIPYRPGVWPIRADGIDRLISVTLTDGVKTWTEPCDALACGFGLAPNLELPMLLGCAIENGLVRVDDRQQTSIPGVCAVGELTGIGGLDKALVEGRIAGTHTSHRQRTKGVRFVELLADAFRLRDELRRLPERDTIVCRCEDVTFGQLQQSAGWRDAKLQTRCGMGPCQGRMCGPAVEYLFGWAPESVRPPLFPTALGNLGVGFPATQQ
jgi:NADPH-dependent 2,4-dienoyl-CoA reductase/sulfur reductase-like enzyme